MAYSSTNHIPSIGTPSSKEITPAAPEPSVWRDHLVILLVYVLLAVVVTWPTVTHLATHLPGDGGDDPAIAWNLWWVKHALLNLRTNPLYTFFMFYPVGINLAFYTLTVLNALTALPLTLNLGVVAASNLHMWFAFMAGAYGAFLLARQLIGGEDRTRAVWAAALAGGFYAFAGYRIFYVALGQFNIASVHWIPYAILFLFKSRSDPKSLRWPVLTALFLTMQAWAEMTYASFLLVFFAVYVTYEIVRYLFEASMSSRQALLCLRNLLVIGILFGVGISPLLAAMLPDMMSQGDFWVQGSGFAESFSADLIGFVVPTMLHPMLGDAVRYTGITAFDKGQHIYLGMVLLILATLGVVSIVLPRRPNTSGFATSNARTRAGGVLWAISALIFAWLSLGPSIRINGVDSGIPGPFVLLQVLPFFKGNRYPSRYSVMLVLSLAMLAALGITAVLRAWAFKRAETTPTPGVTSGPTRVSGVGTTFFCILLGGVFLFEHLCVPLPQSDMHVPAPYYALAAQSGQAALLDVPIAWRNGFRITGPIDPGFMFGQFYQTVHQRPLLQGNTSRNPEFKFQYFTQAPVINSILALETGHQLTQGRLEADRAVSGEVLRFFGIQDIVIRHGSGDNPAVVPEAVLPYVQASMPVELIYTDPTISVFHVNLPPLPEMVEVGANTPLASLHLGEGWGPVADQHGQSGQPLIWAQQRTASLLVALDGGPQRVSWRVFVPGEGQQVSLHFGSRRLDPVPLQSGWSEYSVDIPDDLVNVGVNEVLLEFTTIYPTEVAASQLPDIPITTLVVSSAGQEVGDFGHIYIDGLDVSPNLRGYNVAVIDPQGEVQVATFDTHLDPEASIEMAEFFSAVPAGYTVAVAAADEVSMNLSQQGVDALRSIGARGDLREGFRWSHAVIGIKGAPSGTAIEDVDGLRPVCVTIGPAIAAPQVAAGFDWIRFETR